MTNAAMAMPSVAPEEEAVAIGTGAVGEAPVSVNTGAGVSGLGSCGEATWIHRTISPEE
jgi:hypothetical protein